MLNIILWCQRMMLVEAFDPSGDLKPYTIAKHYADEHLKNSGLNYTIVHPGALEDKEGTSKIETDLYFDGKVLYLEKMWHLC